MRFPPADATPNLALTPGAVDRDVLLVCGEDPETVYALLEENGVRRRSSVDHREFRTSRCELKGVAFTCCITGLGSASVEVAFSELFATGGRRFVHTGTAATLNPRRIPVGAPVMVEVAIRDDGASLHYVPGTGLRVPGHPEVMAAIAGAAEACGTALIRGVGLSTDAFYGCGARLDRGETLPGSLLPLKDGMAPSSFREWLVPHLQTDHPYCLDMEVSTFYALASCVDHRHRVKWGSVKGISNQVPFIEGEQMRHTETALSGALSLALGALGRLARC